jgi:hypothetical protein
MGRENTEGSAVQRPLPFFLDSIAGAAEVATVSLSSPFSGFVLLYGPYMTIYPGQYIHHEET